MCLKLGIKMNPQMAKHWAIKDRDRAKFRVISLRPEIKRARSAAKNLKVKQGMADQVVAVIDGSTYGSGSAIESSSPPRKKAKSGEKGETGDKGKTLQKGKGKCKCKCGSVTHQRVNHSECPLNPVNKMKNNNEEEMELSPGQVTELQATGKGLLDKCVVREVCGICVCCLHSSNYSIFRPN
jgi:hypothetical protein